MMAKKKKQSELEAQESIAFEFRELADAVVRDLKRIDTMCPSESSRTIYGFIRKDRIDEARMNKILLIEARKNDFIHYIQTICRDHVAYLTEAIEAGWTPKLRAKNRKRRV
jgi:hypothetical protein